MDSGLVRMHNHWAGVNTSDGALDVSIRRNNWCYRNQQQCIGQFRDLRLRTVFVSARSR
jgi:hypothetical protein